MGSHEVWYAVASDPREQRGLWVRHTVDDGAEAVWGAWFSPETSFVIRKSAAIGRSLDERGCSGEVEAGGHSLRWRLGFGQGVSGEDFVPGWLKPAGRLRGSGYTLPHPATTVTGAVEVDGRALEFQRVPAALAHLWGTSRYRSWAWARCSAFAEDPDASIDLLDVEGPAGIRVPIFVFRFRGQVHRFAEVPWIALTSSKPSSPAWHFSARDARVAIDGVVRAAHEQMVQVRYDDAHFCVNTEIASMEVRVRSRAVPGAAWRPEATLTSKCAASLEFCGRRADPRVLNLLLEQKQAQHADSVAS